MKRDYSKAIRQAKSEISIMPLNQSVIVKLNYKKSALILGDDKQSNATVLSSKVVAYGENTSIIEIGDNVLISNNANPQLLEVPENHKSHKKVTEANPSGLGEISFTEYMLVNVYDIVAIKNFIE